jgi:hypothetical protein
MHAVAVKTLKDVGVQVNQTRRDELARYVMDTCGLLTRDGRCDACNLAILDRNIVHPVEADRWVTTVPPLSKRSYTVPLPLQTSSPCVSSYRGLA